MMSLFQITFDAGVPVSPISLNQSAVAVGWSVAVLVALVVLGFTARWWHLRAHRKAGGNLHMRVLRIRVPRFVAKEREEANELKAVQEDIGVMETFFSAIGGLRPERGLKAWLLGARIMRRLR